MTQSAVAEAKAQALEALTAMASTARSRLSAQPASLVTPQSPWSAIGKVFGTTPPPVPKRIKLDPNWQSSQYPPRRFAWFPYLPARCVSLLIGEGAVGKSTFLVAMLAHIAAGMSYLGRQTLQGRVVYIAAEDDEQEVMRRLQNVAQGMKMTPFQRAALTSNFEFYPVAGAELNLIRSNYGLIGQTPLVDALAQDIGEALVVAIDPVSRVHGCEENSNTVGTKLVQAGEAIAQKTGAAVIFAHHTGKAAARDELDDAYAARGGSGFADAARSVLRLIAASPESPAVKGLDINSQQLRAGNILRLRHAKSSYERRAKDVWLERDPSGQLQEIAPLPSTERSDAQLLSALRQWWTSTWNKKPFSKSLVRDASKDILGLGVSKAQRETMWGWAIAQGFLIAAENAGRKNQYTFAESDIEPAQPTKDNNGARPEHEVVAGSSVPLSTRERIEALRTSGAETDRRGMESLRQATLKDVPRLPP
jgi:hypothetical protein